ncbi:uncharacterized protein LOC143255424 [Tachypleus tridentatus]|uniref:uncharacterized protein LOC143255424 n=1 Tax=Tachypleus tridentatus TaxID=6853 RepID=UPI003FD2D722
MVAPGLAWAINVATWYGVKFGGRPSMITGGTNGLTGEDQCFVLNSMLAEILARLTCSMTSSRLLSLLKPWPPQAFNGVKLNIRVSGDRPPSKQVVIRGLEIQEELISQGIQATNIERIKSAKTGLPTPLVRISLNDIVLADKLINNGITMWFLKLPVEESKQPAAVTVLQRFNCQKFGHALAACKATPRCVRCSGTHIVTECPKNREETCCANCGGPHAASYRSCPKYAKVVALKRNKLLTINLPENLKSKNLTTRTSQHLSQPLHPRSRPMPMQQAAVMKLPNQHVHIDS